MRATLEAINQMQTDGVIGKYAIGGAVGATFYLQPAATLDVDIFVTLPTSPRGLLLSLAPIYDYLKTRGGVVEDEYIVIGGWPVQFLPPSDELEREAVEESVSTAVEDVGTWVMTAEHLVAIALRTGRRKTTTAFCNLSNKTRWIGGGCKLSSIVMGWLRGGSSLSTSIWEVILEAKMSKPKLRARQAALSFSEKIKILEKLRDRDRAIAASGLRERGERGAGNKAAK